MSSLTVSSIALYEIRVKIIRGSIALEPLTKMALKIDDTILLQPAQFKPNTAARAA
jgi:hypothetical protein